MSAASTPRIVLLADRSRPGIDTVLEKVRTAVRGHAEITAELDSDHTPLPRDLDAQFAVAVGGDGTLISQARRIVDLALPLVGVNVGRLGFLAEFDAESLAEHAAVIFGPDPPVEEHMLIRTTVRDDAGAVVEEEIAVNDCVISAGEPFRMIELRLAIDAAEGPAMFGDGVIVATPTGSTAYNVSAGGPIVHPALDAFVITPLAAHSLAFRPIVVRGSARLRVKMLRTNPGSTLVLDGRPVTGVRAGMTVEIRKHDHVARFVMNPAMTYWRILQDKLRWAAPPSFRRSE